MDFHSLTRKELQALCKINKIPANLTNVAMADSLAALEHVEGVEGILNPSQSGPDESTIVGTPAGPRTSCRTSTRPRKPVVKEYMEVSQSMTRTRRATREVVEEVKEESRDLSSTTLAARNTLRRAPVPSASKKTEIGSVQRAYSTRRSVKLLEETMEKMCLGNDVSVKTDESSKEVSLEMIEDGSREMQMELKYDVYDDAVKEEKVAESEDENVDVKKETLIKEVIDCAPVTELSNEIQSSVIKDVEVSDEVKETVEAISSNTSSALTIEEEDVSLKLETPVQTSTLGDWVVLADDGCDIDDVKTEVVQSESSMEEDEYETEEDEVESVEAIKLQSESVTEKEISAPICEDEDETADESSEEDESESEEESKLPSESVAEKETSEPISEDEETEDEESSDEEEEESEEEEVESKEVSLANNKDSSQAMLDMVSEPVTTESNVKNVEAEENRSFDANQFPRPSLPKPSKSSAEAHPVIQKIENVLDKDEEEETKDKNDKKTASKKLEERSLRELHKLLKAKLQITKDEKETNTTRIALQPLQENRLAVDELQKN